MTQRQGSSAEQTKEGAKMVLVIEDDPDIGAFLVKAIEQELSHEALLVPDGLQAFQVVRDIKPNLFLLDYHLPSMDGIELYDRLHAMKGFDAIPAVMISAHLPRQQVEERGIVGLQKPVELETFLHTIEKLLS